MRWCSSTWVPCSVRAGLMGGQCLAIMGSSIGRCCQCISLILGHPRGIPPRVTGYGVQGAPSALALTAQAPRRKGDLSHVRATFAMSGCQLGDRTFKAPLPEQSRSPAHPKSPFAVTSYDLKLKQGSMNNVMRSFFSSCLQILRGRVKLLVCLISGCSAI